MMKVNLFFSCLVVLMSFSNAFSQSDSKSEEELKLKANELFEADNFIEAKPLYAQLLSLYPKDPDYNFKYGTSVLLTEPDRDKAIKYLNFATSRGTVNPQAYFYLGLAHHLNYNFAKAVKVYSRFKTKAKADNREKFQIDRQIEMAKNGNSLLSKLNEVQVVERKEIAEKDFYRIYKTDDLEGKMVALPDEFKSKYDKKVGFQSVVFLPTNPKELYFASYGKKSTKGKDIYKTIRLGEGGWSEPVKLGGAVNTPYDEDYAFIHPDGRTLYFASKGHNSMGGYDIFKSTFDSEINEWRAPENLDFAFSSASDDIMFVTNKEGSLAYFASNRSTEFGKITVYRVLTERKPVDLSVIKGKFIVENNTDGQKAKITLIDQETQETVGVYETDQSGNYTIEIAKNGGDYQFNLETTSDAPIHTGVVSIPKQDEFEVLGQELRLVGTGEAQQLVIKNIFDGTMAESLKGVGPKVSAETIRMKANLKVNYSEDQLAELLTEDESNSTPVSQVVTNLDSEKETTPSSNSEQQVALRNKSEDEDKGSLPTTLNGETIRKEIDNFQKELNEGIDQKQKAINTQYSVSIAYEEEAKQLFDEAENLASSDSSGVEVIVKKKQAGIKALEASFAVQIAQELEKSLNEDLTLADKVETEKTNIEQQLADNQLADAEQAYTSLLQEETKSIEELLNNRKEELQEDKRISIKKLGEVNERNASYNEERETLRNSLEKLNAEFEVASKKKKEELQKNIEATELDLRDIEYQYEAIQKGKKRNQLALKSIELEEQQLMSALNSFSANTVASTISEEEKDQLISQLKSYRDNDVIAYSETNELYADEFESIPSAEITTLNNSLNEESEGGLTEIISPSTNENEGLALNDNETFAAINDSFEKKITDSELITEELVQLETKIELTANWTNALQAKQTSQKTKLQTEIEESNRVELQTEIESIQKQVVENNRNLKSFKTRLKELKEGTAEPLPSLVANVDAIDETTIINDDFGNLKYQQQLNPTTSISQQQLVFAKRSLYEAGEIAKQEELTRESAYGLETPEDREAAFLKANELKKEAEVKQLEAAELFARFNLQEFRANQSQIRRANNFEEGASSASLDLANLLAEEAESFFTNAVEIRNSINPEDRLTKKEVNLQKAYDYEILAIQKQKEAMEKLDIVSVELLNNLIQSKTGVKTTAASTTSQSTSSTLVSDNVIKEGEGLLQPSEVDSQLRESSLEESSTAIDAKVIDSEPIELIQPKSASIYNQIAIDTVEISEERKQTILSAQTFIDFKQNREKLARQINEASFAYFQAQELADKNEQLKKQAIVETEAASSTLDKTEKERLIKSAEIITQSIVKNQNAIDSLNSVIAEKNAEIEYITRDDSLLVATLSEAEKQEYITLLETAVIDNSAITETSTVETEEQGGELSSENIIEQEETSKPQENFEQQATEDFELPLLDELSEEPIQTIKDSDSEEEDNLEDEPTTTPIRSTSSPRTLDEIDIIPRKVKEAIFITLSKDESAYNETKPIPAKIEMPTGIVYKVQVGAFRNPIPQNLFKGFAPLMAEKSSGGITRYTAGLFSTEAAALSARNKIRSIGYSDAFVVAFKDGVRVGVATLRDVANESVSNEIEALEEEYSPLTEEIEEQNAISSEEQLIATEESESWEAELEEPGIEQAINTESVKGLFFTIQIGVFSSPVKEGTFGYDDLNVVKIADNLYRYSTGIFSSLIAAGEYKNTVSSTIDDAFITAYYDGKRVSLEEAARLKNN